MPDDMIINLNLININIEKRSIPLKDCEVNYDNDTFGGQLTIKAPNARLPIFHLIVLLKIGLIMLFIMK